jgi:uncharacterized protein (DUF305 family)
MRKILLLAAATFAAIANPAIAQDQKSGMQGNTVDLSILPEGCRAAVQGMDMSQMMGGMDMSKMMGGVSGMQMDEAQTAYMEAMVRMHGPMMAAHMIKDPDLAFNCGMIAHHTGAIDMAKVVLDHGKDDETKKMASKIIEAQVKEIKEMSNWVAEHTGK